MVEIVYFGMIWSLFITARAGEFCTSSASTNGRLWCPSSCCESGDTGTFCCDSKTGLILGIGFGVITLIGVAVLILALCCSPKTKGQTGKDCHPAGDISTVPAHGVETTTVATGYRQAGYTSGTIPQQMQPPNILADNGQKWADSPPPYTSVIPG